MYPRLKQQEANRQHCHNPGHQQRPPRSSPGPLVWLGHLLVAGSASGSARGPVRGSLMTGVACHRGTLEQRSGWPSTVRWCSNAAMQAITVLVAAQGKQILPNREQQRALQGPAYPAVSGAPSRRARTLTHPLHIDETFQIGPSGVAARGTIDYQIITFNHFMWSQITSGRRSANICLISTLNCDLQARPRLDPLEGCETAECDHKGAGI